MFRMVVGARSAFVSQHRPQGKNTSDTPPRREVPSWKISGISTGAET